MTDIYYGTYTYRVHYPGTLLVHRWVESPGELPRCSRCFSVQYTNSLANPCILERPSTAKKKFRKGFMQPKTLPKVWEIRGQRTSKRQNLREPSLVRSSQRGITIVSERALRRATYAKLIFLTSWRMRRAYELSGGP